MTKIVHPDNFLKLDISAVEKYYGAIFVGEFPYPVADGFAPIPVSIFKRPKEAARANQPEYFGIVGATALRMGGHLYKVVDANYITGYKFNGLQWGDEIVYSRFEQDRRTFPNAAFISGGFTKREWGKGSGVPAKLVKLQVINGTVTLVD